MKHPNSTNNFKKKTYDKVKNGNLVVDGDINARVGKKSIDSG